MRTATPFLNAYRKSVPSPELIRGSRGRDACLVDLALHFLATRLPRETVDAVPFLLSGYPQLAGERELPSRELQSLRHLCPAYASPYAWTTALEVHQSITEVNRAYRVEREGRAVRRQAASDDLLNVLETTLIQPAPYVERRLTLAVPGPGRVFVDHRKTRLDYVIPSVSEADIACRGYELIKRSHNPPIAIRWSALLDVAREIDKSERSPDWHTKTGLNSINLEQRLSKVNLKSLDQELFRDGVLTLEGVRHLVGMLSSGKSTLVLALLLTLARPEYSRRILVLSSDTTSAATLSARLHAHGVNATVLSSFDRRDEHLSSIHWHQAMTGASGWSMSGMGRLVANFGVACPLDGHQVELRPVTGIDHGTLRFPLMSEKPCHSIEQEASSRIAQDEQEETSTAPAKRSCPLYSKCPAQSQQRNAVDAQVLIMTAPAFLMMNPDRHVLSSSMSFPELAQFTRDLVIVDEADEVQRSLDEHFAVPAPIMGGEGSYLPQSALAVHTALLEQGGAQYISRLNVAWQARLSRLEIAVSGLYSILLNRWDDMSGLHLESEFTAATILCKLWKTRADAIRGVRDFQITGETEIAFQRILSMTGRLATLDEPDPLPSDTDHGDTDGEDALSQSATETLVSLRSRLRNGASWRSLLPEVQEALTASLLEFNTFEVVTGNPGKQLKAAERNALGILAALYANIILSSFNFLVRNQAAVSAAFQLDEYTLLDATRELMRKYRALLPESPNGNAFGLVYEHHRQGDTPRGDLKLVSNLGVGRYLLTNLHALLQSEGQAGPHVLLLSGTSWAGGRMTMNPMRKNGNVPSAQLPRSLPEGVASPSYDVQVRVSGYLEQPEQEREQLRHSECELVAVPAGDGRALTVSGLPTEVRRINLQRIAEHLTTETGGRTRLEWQWVRNEQSWGTGFSDERHRALLVVQSYQDAAVVANAIQRQIDTGSAPNHRVYSLVSDRVVRSNAVKDPILQLLSGVVAMPRSLVEDFGLSPKGSILIAPLSVIARGHNILNKHGVAAVSTIYFLHRPHPRPDDRSGIVGQVNRFAIECLNGDARRIPGTTAVERGRTQRYVARMIARRALSARGGYSMMPPDEQARFAWNLLTPLWQTIGRGIRGGVPVYVGFIDSKFSPGDFHGEPETASRSCLRQVLAQLHDALDEKRNADHAIAQKLYGPLYECLNRMFDGVQISAEVRDRAEFVSEQLQSE